MHEMAQEGGPPINRRRALRSCIWRSPGSTTGPTRAVGVVEPVHRRTEWSYIPHFYRDFYVFQYAGRVVSTASSALAEKVKAATREAKKRYIPPSSSAGGSKYPVDLLKDARRRHDQPTSRSI